MQSKNSIQLVLGLQKCSSTHSSLPFVALAGFCQTLNAMLKAGFSEQSTSPDNTSTCKMDHAQGISRQRNLVHIRDCFYQIPETESSPTSQQQKSFLEEKLKIHQDSD